VSWSVRFDAYHGYCLSVRLLDAVTHADSTNEVADHSIQSYT
jgi:hypothetical protein